MEVSLDRFEKCLLKCCASLAWQAINTVALISCLSTDTLIHRITVMFILPYASINLLPRVSPEHSTLVSTETMHCNLKVEFHFSMRRHTYPPPSSVTTQNPSISLPQQHHHHSSSLNHGRTSTSKASSRKAHRPKTQPTFALQTRDPRCHMSRFDWC